MKTDNDAIASGIDPRAIVADGVRQLHEALGELGEKAILSIETAGQAWAILSSDQPALAAPWTRSNVEEVRAKMVQMRDGLLTATKFEWAVVCTHAIWWLSAMLEE